MVGGRGGYPPDSHELSDLCFARFVPTSRGLPSFASFCSNACPKCLALYFLRCPLFSLDPIYHHPMSQRKFSSRNDLARRTRNNSPLSQVSAPNGELFA